MMNTIKSPKTALNQLIQMNPGRLCEDCFYLATDAR